MKAKTTFAIGSVAGAAIALVVMINYWGHFTFVPVGVHDWIDRNSFGLCPLWGLGFTGLMNNDVELATVALLGNAFLYGIIVMLCNLVIRMSKVTIRSIR